MGVHSFCNLMQKITVYENKETFYVIGSDEDENCFRVLEINRNERRQLLIYEDHKMYSLEKMKAYLNKVKENDKRKGRSVGGLNKVTSGYFIAGFVKFTEGYYMILVTSRRKVAMIGSHSIYKVDSTKMIYIPNDKSTRNPLNSEEVKYTKLFDNVDFSNNFYFSYTYDLTNTLQYNHTEMDPSRVSHLHPKTEIRQEPVWRFVWNEYLLEPVLGKIHDDWIVYLVHCYLSQLNMIVYGTHIYLTLIARRSNRYAGTRFLKRGVNTEGNVANEVETEQIVFDASQTALNDGAITSYVQMRGSVPLYWSQEMSNVMQKPPISVDMPDPYGEISSRHFKYMISRYGTPIIILNLVKRHEKRKRESKLWDELSYSLDYLNQFLTKQDKIRYVAFDMARSNRKSDSNVLAHLADIAENCISRTGLYIRNCPLLPDRKQTGTVRTNCVDCLDRTNTAQFAVGKQVLGHQLHVLGVLPTTELVFDTDCIRMLEVLYEDQGDTIALQYGGSHLVHRVQSYRKTDPLTSHSNDILQTLSRYVSNSFSDAEKQQAYNVFLGVYRPWEHQRPLWELMTDRYIHNRHSIHKTSYCSWLDSKIAEVLPRPYDESVKKFHTVEREDWIQLQTEFNRVYRPQELTCFDNFYPITMKNSVNSFMPAGISMEITPNLYSPFEVRRTNRWGRASTDQHQAGNSGCSQAELGNSVFHTSTLMDDDDEDRSEESDSDLEIYLSSSESDTETEKTVCPRPFHFQDILKGSIEEYGLDMNSHPSKLSNILYKQYAAMYAQTEPDEKPIQVLPSPPLTRRSIFQFDSEFCVEPPTVKKETKAFYKKTVLIAQHGVKSIPKSNLALYERYVNMI